MSSPVVAWMMRMSRSLISIRMGVRAWVRPTPMWCSRPAWARPRSESRRPSGTPTGWSTRRLTSASTSSTPPTCTESCQPSIGLELADLDGRRAEYRSKHRRRLAGPLHECGLVGEVAVGARQSSKSLRSRLQVHPRDLSRLAAHRAGRRTECRYVADYAGPQALLNGVWLPALFKCSRARSRCCGAWCWRPSWPAGSGRPGWVIRARRCR
jgi:hypothetical protein